MSSPSVDELLAIKQEAAQAVINVDEPLVKLVIVSLAGRFFAFKGELIREVLPGDEPLFFVPGMPASVEGVINVRGDIESVILLQALLQLPATKKSNKTSLLLAKTSQMQTGIRVDQLVDVIDWPLNQLQNPPESLPEALKPYVSALLDFFGKPVALLELEKLFSDYQAGKG